MVSSLLLICGLTFPDTTVVEVHTTTLEVNRYLSDRQPGVGNPYYTQLVALDSKGRYVASILLEGDAPTTNRSPMIVEHYGTIYKIHFKQLSRTWSITDPFAKCMWGTLFNP